MDQHMQNNGLGSDIKKITKATGLDKLAKKLRLERQKNGSIFFDKAEVKFNLDKDGNPIGVFFNRFLKFCGLSVPELNQLGGGTCGDDIEAGANVGAEHAIKFFRSCEDTRAGGDIEGYGCSRFSSDTAADDQVA